jgi:hypothetical protein
MQRRRQRIHYRNARHTFRDCSGGAEARRRSGEIKRILDFSIKILFSRNSRYARAFYNVRTMALLRFLFPGVNATHKSSLKRDTILDNESILSAIINGDFK